VVASKEGDSARTQVGLPVPVRVGLIGPANSIRKPRASCPKRACAATGSSGCGGDYVSGEKEREGEGGSKREREREIRKAALLTKVGKPY
jgi:hypothetical protein